MHSKFQLTKKIDGEVWYYNKTKNKWQTEKCYFKADEETATRFACLVHDRETDRMTLSDIDNDFSFELLSKIKEKEYIDSQHLRKYD